MEGVSCASLHRTPHSIESASIYKASRIHPLLLVIRLKTVDAKITTEKSLTYADRTMMGNFIDPQELVKQRKALRPRLFSFSDR